MKKTFVLIIVTGLIFNFPHSTVILTPALSSFYPPGCPLLQTAPVLASQEVYNISGPAALCDVRLSRKDINLKSRLPTIAGNFNPKKAPFKPKLHRCKRRFVFARYNPRS